MDITLEAVEKVIDATGVDFKTAKKALEVTEGNVEDAIKYLTPEKDNAEVKDIIDKIKERVEEGNVTKVQIRRKDEILLSLPVNVGIIGGVVGVAAAPWAFIAGAIAAFGFGCTVEIVKKDGTIDKVE
ncbi:protein of unknown function [Butyrivibrio fibrisolvens DSM 3071]|uniref:DUF4342 domain-containing protein n=1 Tax=Butyrivibrio fibrisolvens DSM 3071 TaxID=1121131 RepID=A0A1M5Z292_BUTFI|nr:DUF4342 domain-containing protein [Butyrivibrio fibrisolvens]SHI18329.1 protein of unknown function [Butyrivibrio fibrisolvens DSM 3071]